MVNSGACETAETYEIIGARIEFANTSSENILDAIQKYNFKRFIALVKNRYNGTVGPYIASDYFDMFKQLEKIACDLAMSYVNNESRQLVISFHKLHCFQNIQFLIRGNTIYVIGNMRSCNYKKNLMFDAALVAYCAEEICKATGWQNMQVNVIMNIGSLHIFKDDA